MRSAELLDAGSIFEIDREFVWSRESSRATLQQDKSVQRCLRVLPKCGKEMMKYQKGNPLLSPISFVSAIGFKNVSITLLLEGCEIVWNWITGS